MAESPPSDAEIRPPLDRELKEAIAWHGVWAILTLGAVALIGVGARAGWTGLAALAVGAAPGLAGLGLARFRSPRAKALLLGRWAGCGVGACLLAGGVAGPLAILCVAPAAAAAVFGSSRLLAEGAALSLAAAAIAALAGLAGLAPAPPPAAVAFWVSLTALVVTGMGFGAGLLLARGRAGRLQAGRRASEEAMEQLLSEQPHLLLVLDPSGEAHLAFGSPPAGIPESALLGRRLPELAAAEGRADLESALSSVRTGAPVEHRFAPAGAPDRTVALTLKRGADGRLLAMLRDATADQARELQLEIAREEAEGLNAGKSRFLANMSHELRTPLNAVIGFSDVMRAGLFGQLSPKYAEYADMIHDAGQHLLGLINDVLDLSKVEADRYELSREAFDARDAVSSALRLTRVQADTAGISLRGLLPTEPLDVMADPRALKQIVLNLVSNALKFTPRGGSVTVTAQADGEDLEVSVSDTGVGIAEKDLERLGQPYEQAGDTTQKVRGTGLGLSLVRAFAELHGGSMSIESRLGEGTSVTVRMPVVVLAAPSGTESESLGAKIIQFKPNGKVGA